MIEYPIKDANNNIVRSAELSETVFGRPMRKDLISLVIRYQNAKRNALSGNTKSRSEVRGGGRKPYRQKGTGNARQGTIRAPQFRGGGITFGPTPRKGEMKVQKKVRRLALQSAISAKRQSGELTLLDTLDIESGKTKTLQSLLKAIEVGRSTLIVIPEKDVKIESSARNIPHVSVIRVEGVNVYDLVAHQSIVMSEATAKKIEERLS